MTDHKRPNDESEEVFYKRLARTALEASEKRILARICTIAKKVESLTLPKESEIAGSEMVRALKELQKNSPGAFNVVMDALENSPSLFASDERPNSPTPADCVATVNSLDSLVGLSPAEVSFEVRQHAASCTTCQEMIAEFRAGLSNPIEE